MLGIGANTAIFTLLYGLVLRSLPVHDASGLVKVGIASAAEPNQEDASFMPYRMFQALGLPHSLSSLALAVVWLEF